MVTFHYKNIFSGYKYVYIYIYIYIYIGLYTYMVVGITFDRHNYSE